MSTKIPLTEFLQLGRPFTWALFSPHADIIGCMAVAVVAVVVVVFRRGRRRLPLAVVGPRLPGVPRRRAVPHQIR